MSEKIDELIAAAKNNDTDAQNDLYEFDSEDDLSESDRKQIVDWLQLSAKQGNAESMYKIGSCYKEGFGFVKDEKIAYDWFVKSANAGYSLAFWRIGMLYKDGNGATKDYTKAIEWFEKAIEKFGGDIASEEELGGNGCDVDDESLAWWEAVSARKSSVIQYPAVPFEVGNYYYDQDPIRAFHFYKIAAEQGYGHAQYLLGKFLYTGEGVEKDAQMALHWLEKAALQDVVSSMYYLGKLYADDSSEAFDMDKAVSWWQESLSLGDPEAPGLVELELSWHFALKVFDDPEVQGFYEKYALDNLLQAAGNTSSKISIVVDEDSWWYRHVKRGGAQALYWMGMCYLHITQLEPADGSDKNACMLSCFRKAAAQGNPNAIEQLQTIETKFSDKNKDLTDEFTATLRGDIPQDEYPEDAAWPRTVLIRPKAAEVIHQSLDDDYDSKEDTGYALAFNQDFMMERVNIESWGNLHIPNGYELYDRNDRAAYNAYLESN